MQQAWAACLEPKPLLSHLLRPSGRTVHWCTSQDWQRLAADRVLGSSLRPEFLAGSLEVAARFVLEVPFAGPKVISLTWYCLKSKGCHDGRRVLTRLEWLCEKPAGPLGWYLQVSWLSDVGLSSLVALSTAVRHDLLNEFWSDRDQDAPEEVSFSLLVGRPVVRDVTSEPSDSLSRWEYALDTQLRPKRHVQTLDLGLSEEQLLFSHDLLQVSQCTSLQPRQMHLLIQHSGQTVKTEYLPCSWSYTCRDQLCFWISCWSRRSSLGSSRSAVTVFLASSLKWLILIESNQLNMTAFKLNSRENIAMALMGFVRTTRGTT